MRKSTNASTITIRPAARPLRGEITVPGDKSISHRSIMFGALADGDTRVRGFLRGADCLSTISCFRQLGIHIEEKDDEIIVHGKGLYGLHAAGSILDAGNSGTTVRLMSGILCGQSFDSIITGDASIQKRPMRRIITPLSMMGGCIESMPGNGCVPLLIKESRLSGITYHSPVASAQVKSCILLAGLYADDATTVVEPVLSRDHTERMLRGFGADITSEPVKTDSSGVIRSAYEPHEADETKKTNELKDINGIDGINGIDERNKSYKTQKTASTYTSHAARIQPHPSLHGMDITVPGDISSAAYFIAAALIVPGSQLLIRNVGINPTRDGILKVAKEMGGNIELLNERETGGEPVADLLVRHTPLRGIRIDGAIIPTLIDELPVIAVMAACAEGTTVIADAAELKVKESNRIDVVSGALQTMGVAVTPTDDGMIIEGNGGPRTTGSSSTWSFSTGSLSDRPFKGAEIDSQEDHRIAMSFAVAGLAADTETKIKGAECVRISYPGFFTQFISL